MLEKKPLEPVSAWQLDRVRRPDSGSRQGTADGPDSLVRVSAERLGGGGGGKLDLEGPTAFPHKIYKLIVFTQFQFRTRFSGCESGGSRVWPGWRSAQLRRRGLARTLRRLLFGLSFFFGELFLPYMREEASINRGNSFLSKLRRSFEANSSVIHTPAVVHTNMEVLFFTAFGMSCVV